MRRIGNKGFSLVELIIVMAIMAVLVGILSPQYIKYLDKTKKVSDCSIISAILDSCEVIAGDPNIEWESGDEHKIAISVSNSSVSYAGGPEEELRKIVPEESAVLRSGDWGTITIDAVKVGSSKAIFIADEEQVEALGKYSDALAGRFE